MLVIFLRLEHSFSITKHSEKAMPLNLVQSLFRQDGFSFDFSALMYTDLVRAKIRLSFKFYLVT